MAGNEPFVCNFGAFFTYTIYLVEKKSGEVSCVVIGVKRRQSDSTVFLIFNVFACNFSGCSGINTQDVRNRKQYVPDRYIQICDRRESLSEEKLLQ